MQTIAVIPVRGGSKSIPRKNIKLIAGRPLLHWTLEAAVQCPQISSVIVSSDSEEILATARELGSWKVCCVVRPPELATDTATTESALLHAVSEVDYDRVVLIQATSPLLTSHVLSEALTLHEAKGLDSLLSVTHEHRFRWRATANGAVLPENYDPLRRPRRQDWEGELLENGAFYITSRIALEASRCRISGRIGHYVMSGRTALELDAPEDWDVVESFLVRKRVMLLPPHRIRLLISDVDGVLTDGGMYYGQEGEVLKKFNTRDGMGLQLFRDEGNAVAIVTGESSPSVAARAAKLGISELHLGVRDKLPVVQAIAQKAGLQLSEVAYIGDDLNDIAVLRAVGVPACPADAVPEVCGVARLRTTAVGGSGAVRELVDLLNRHNANYPS